MCEYKSGIIFKNRVELAPAYNDSHSALLKRLGVDDSRENAMRKFVRAELIPPRGNRTADVSEWKFKVDQDIVPEWFDLDRQKYEEEFRSAVEKFVKEATVVICGKSWTPIKTENGATYYLLNGSLCDKRFGDTNNYAESNIRKYLNDCGLLEELKAEFGEILLPITLDLTSMDGLRDYGVIEGDYLSLMNLDLYRECREKIPNLDKPYALATPDSTSSGFSSGDVLCVRSGGGVGYNWCYYDWSVRPFFILKS